MAAEPQAYNDLMRKKTGSIFKYTFVFLFCISATAFSQNITLDSLLNVLRSEQDNKRINTLLEISYKYSEVGKTQQEYLYAKQALDLSKKLKWPKGEISAMCQMAFSLQSQGYYDSADVIARKVMLLSDELKDPG